MTLSPPDGGRTERPPPVLIAIGFVLVMLLAGVAWLQYNEDRELQWSISGDSVQLLHDYLQLESEGFEVRERLRRAVYEPHEADLDELSQRYEVFVSRVRIVEAIVLETSSDAIWHLPQEGRRTVAAVGGFVKHADPLIGAAAQARPGRADLARLLTELDGLHDPMRELRLFANSAISDDFAQRSRVVASQARIGMTMTVLLCVLITAFALIVVRQIKRLHSGRAALQAANLSLASARVDAEAASVSKSTFLANMSHELRTPFQGLLGMLELVERGPLDAHQQSHLRTARDSALHLLRLLDDLLDIAKLESGRLDLVTEPVEIRRLLGDIEGLMRGHANARGLALTMSCADAVPPWVCADPTRLKQVLFNLLSNAIKFTESGRVELAVATSAAGISFAISDTGIGIDEQTLARLFVRFEQADASTSRRYGGTGLGLEISRNLARLMGGDITVSSVVGQGSRFTLELPLAAVDAQAEQPVAIEDREIPPLDILVADDNPINRRYLQALLEKSGHRVRLCANGRETFESVQATDFDAVLLDIHMPVMDGLAAARAIRGIPGRRGRVFIAAISADAFDESRGLALAAGADEFLTKPVRSDRLLGMLGARFGRSDEPAASTPVPLDSHPGVEQLPLLDPQRRSDLLAVISLGQLAEIERILESQAESTLARIRASFAAGDATELQHLAHGFKGAALEIGLSQLAELVRLIEVGARRLASETRTEALRASIAAAIEAVPAVLQRSLAAAARSRSTDQALVESTPPAKA